MRKMFVCAAFALSAKVATAQAILDELSPGAIEGGKAAIEAFPEVADTVMGTLQMLSQSEHELPGEAECLSVLQAVVNGGALIANLMPFSSVETFEDERGPVGRVRAIIGGDKLHVETYGRDATLVSANLEWGAGSVQPSPYARGTVDVSLGLLLLGAINGVFSPGLEDALAAEPEAEASPPPPLTQGERDALRTAIERCWIVDPGSPAASVTVIVGTRMTRDAKPDAASIDLLGAQGGDDTAVRIAYEAARRAMLRCGADGIPLPPEKYEHWAQLELTFSPEGLRVR